MKSPEATTTLYEDRAAITRPPDFWNLYIRKLHPTLPEDWRWSSIQRIEGDGPDIAQVFGGVCRVKFKTGPRKGEDNWDRRDRTWDRTFIIPHADLLKFEAEWERATKLCRNCGNSGLVWAGWSKDAGNRYKPCYCGREPLNESLTK